MQNKFVVRSSSAILDFSFILLGEKQFCFLQSMCLFIPRYVNDPVYLKSKRVFDLAGKNVKEMVLLGA